MHKTLRAIAGLVLGYAIGVAAGVALITLFSANTHDKSLEMAMTSAFVSGPIGAVAGLVIALVRSGRKAASG